MYPEWHITPSWLSDWLRGPKEGSGFQFTPGFPKAFPKTNFLGARSIPHSGNMVAAPDIEAHFCFFPHAALGLGHFRGASGKMRMGSGPLRQSQEELYTLAVMGPGPPDRQPAQISRRYSDFERLHRNLQRQFRGPMSAISFPRKRLRRNFTAETIARRSRAFEQFLGHLQAVPELRQAPDLQDFFVLPELRRAQSLTCTGLYREALALWANAWQLQTQLGTPSGPDRPLLTLAGLAVCHQELEDPGEARACCEKALQLLGDKRPHPFLAPFLEAHVRLSWRLGLDKRQSEAQLQALQEAGLTPTPPPSLKELLIKEVLD
ncbi:sorting nexin-21 isoform X2 [Arvicanthis niloticus]|uniref:sorting nexin-21 isoform X2 n=2 Tax=Arvicanthis niloticus TaxID=61156 RepID=UPI00402BA3D9